jgi:hypothetical protein
MTQHQRKSHFNFREKGQSLVEVALFLPIFLIIIAGLVEVSNILVTQNNVHNAARVGARFGASGGQDEGIALAALNAVTDVLTVDNPDLWDIWAIRGEISEDGNSFDEWEFNHEFGNMLTEAYANIDEDDIKAAVLEELQTDENGNQSAEIAADLKFVGNYLIYDLDSILGLNALQNLAGFTSVESLNVMRNHGTDEVVTDACTAFPIALEWHERSVLPPGTDGANRWRTDIDYPPLPPNYYSFVNHVPNIGLENAREGYLYNIQNGATTGGKGWLCWNSCACDKPDLEEALTWPGNSDDQTPQSGSCPGYEGPRVKGFVEVGDSTDRGMHIGDRVKAYEGSVKAVKGDVAEHVDLGRALRIIVYEEYGGTGNDKYYKIKAFAIMRLHAFSLDQGGGESFILAEFIKWDNSCGQIAEE